MYKLLIVDDEQIVLDAISFVVKNNFSDIIVGGIAKSGREAIEKAEIIKPDIIFMDIKMPGIDGIQAIREIKENYKNAHFVINTAYEHFEYAKEALELGVVEYLLKPVNKHKIISILSSLKEKIEKERKKRSKALAFKEKFETVLPIVESQFIYSIILNSDEGANHLEIYRDILEINSGGYIITLAFDQEEAWENLYDTIEEKLKSQQFYNAYREHMKRRCKCMISPFMLNRIVTFIPYSESVDEYSNRLEALDLVHRVYSELKGKTERKFYIGIGKTYDNLEGLYKSYEESLNAMKYSNSKNVIHITDVEIERQFIYEYSFNIEKALLDKISLGNTKEAVEIFEDLYKNLHQKYKASLEDLKPSMIELLVLIHRIGLKFSVEESHRISGVKIIEKILKIDNLEALKRWCLDEIILITNDINLYREKKVCDLILRAKKYMDENYQKEIALENVSKEVNISPHYFSKLFKDELGTNFIDYLTQLRIAKAKELLKDTDMNMKEISYSIGYRNPNYFSRIFKKIAGVTPKEFKEA